MTAPAVGGVVAIEDETFWLAMKDSFYWQSNCQGVAFGEPSEETAFNFGGINVMAIF